MNDRQKRIIELAESWTDECLAWVIGLPAPFTFVAVAAWTAAAFAAGAWLL